MIQRVTVPGKWLCPNHILCMPSPRGSVQSAPEILDSSVHYPVLDHPLDTRPCPTKCMIFERFKEPHNKHSVHFSSISMNRTYPISSVCSRLEDDVTTSIFYIILFSNSCIVMVHDQFPAHRASPIHSTNIGSMDQR